MNKILTTSIFSLGLLSFNNLAYTSDSAGSSSQHAQEASSNSTGSSSQHDQRALKRTPGIKDLKKINRELACPTILSREVIKALVAAQRTAVDHRGDKSEEIKHTNDQVFALKVNDVQHWNIKKIIESAPENSIIHAELDEQEHRRQATNKALVNNKFCKYSLMNKQRKLGEFIVALGHVDRMAAE